MSLIAECFRRLTQGHPRHELKGYKVTDVGRTRKFGVACRSLQELKRKACSKLNVTNDLAEVNVFLLDGSLIDEEYFHTLEPQTTLILQRPGEKVLSDADLLYDTLRRVNIDFLTAGDQVSEFLTEKLRSKVAQLYDALHSDDTKTACSRRDEHPEWFHGLETNYTTKEAYMHRRCQDRIRGYLYKTIEQIKSSEVYLNDRRARQHLLQAIAFFKLQLKEDHYFGHYFDRSRALVMDTEPKDTKIKNTVLNDAESKSTELKDTEPRDETDSSSCYDHCPCRLERLDDLTYFRLFGSIRMVNQDTMDGPVRKTARKDEQEEVVQCPYRIQPGSREPLAAICDRSGEFRCQGAWNLDECRYGTRHRINPYRSREELVLFSTWNLDHRIERSRSLIPRLLEISVREAVNEKEILECYDNLFTLKNLRLVHILCHEKEAHK